MALPNYNLYELVFIKLHHIYQSLKFKILWKYMAEFIYIDNSNLTIEGMRLSAVKTGKARSFQDSIDNKIFDQTFSGKEEA